MTGAYTIQTQSGTVSDVPPNGKIANYG